MLYNTNLRKLCLNGRGGFFSSPHAVFIARANFSGATQLLLFCVHMHAWRMRLLRDGLSRYTVSSVASSARGPGQTKRYGPWHVTTCSQAHSRLLRNLLNGWCQPRSHGAPRSWPSANIESKSCTTCLGPFVLRKPACARTLICQRHQSQFECFSACACGGPYKSDVGR